MTLEFYNRKPPISPKKPSGGVSARKIALIVFLSLLVVGLLALVVTAFHYSAPPTVSTAVGVQE
jgi:hypothetical protein